MEKEILQHNSPRELTVRGFILAFILTIILAVSNAYLALKLGILASASISAAIFSMGILRFFKDATVLENNAVQTAASAGEAVAGGIVYTIPALVIIGFWQRFDYLDNFLIAFCGGFLGVFFSIPLRRTLVQDPSLRFPEGRAIAEILKSYGDRSLIKTISTGGLLGALIEFLQSGLQILVSGSQYWWYWGQSLFGVGLGFSATMIGAGFLIGQIMAISIFLGAVLNWLIALPLISHFNVTFFQEENLAHAATLFWNEKLRYVGIGAMLFAGLYTFLLLVRPLLKSLQTSMRSKKQLSHIKAQSDTDLSGKVLLGGIAVVTIFLSYLFYRVLPFDAIGFSNSQSIGLMIGAVLYVLIAGFLFSVITAYFSGMVGVTATPGSAIVISGILLASWLLLHAMSIWVMPPIGAAAIQAAEAVIITTAAIVTGIAAIANDNTQDLKVGHLIGATPWKQQIMLLFGVLISAIVIPWVMQLLLDVYGIVGTPGVAMQNPDQALPAPTSAMLAAITKALFRGSMPWDMLGIGAIFIIVVVVFRRLLISNIQLSALGIGIGMYLPMSTSLPLFLGGMLSWYCDYRLKHQSGVVERIQAGHQTGILIACGLVAGSALMDVVLAIPFSLGHSSDILRVTGSGWHPYGLALSVIVMASLMYWMIRRIIR